METCRGTAVVPSDFKPKEDDSEDRIEKIFIRKEKIYEFEDNARKAVAKIGKMYTDMIQKEFFLIKASKK